MTEQQAPRRVVVTGGGRGIGAAIVARFVRDGAHVVAMDLPGVHPGNSGEPGLTGIDVDVTNSAAVAVAFEQAVGVLGGIDVLVNNAGIAEPRQRLEVLEESTWARVLDVNVGGTLRCTKAALPHLRAGSRAAVVSIASTWALGGVAGFHAYTASKSAIVGLTRGLAVELGEWNVRVNAVCPGYVATDMGDAVRRLPADERVTAAAERDRQASFQPLPRQCEPEEVADAVAFLSAAGASFVTGATLAVDGGQSGRLNTGEQVPLL